MCSVECRGRVLIAWVSAHGVGVHASCISVSGDGDEAVHVPEFESERFEV